MSCHTAKQIMLQSVAFPRYSQMPIVLSMIAPMCFLFPYCSKGCRLTRSSLAGRDRHASNSAAGKSVCNRSVLLSSFCRLQLLGSSSLSPFTASRHELRGFQIGKEIFADLLHSVAEGEVGNHDQGQFKAELQRASVSPLPRVLRVVAYRARHFEQLKPVIQFRDEFGCPRKRDGRNSEKTIVQRRILGNTLAEWSTLEIDNKGGDLLAQTQKVDSRVEEGRRVLRFKVDGASAVGKGM